MYIIKLSTPNLMSKFCNYLYWLTSTSDSAIVILIFFRQNYYYYDNRFG